MAQAHFALKEQKPFFMTPQITYTGTYIYDRTYSTVLYELTSSLCIPATCARLGSKVDGCALIGPGCLVYRASSFERSCESLDMAGEDAALTGWRVFINTHTISGRRNVR